MKNFEKNIEEATDTELFSWINNRDFKVTPLASDELTRRGIERLNESIDKNTIQLKDFSDSSKKSSYMMERFTMLLFLIAMVQLLVAMFQLLTSLIDPTAVPTKVIGIVGMLAATFILFYFSKQILPKDMPKK